MAVAFEGQYSLGLGVSDAAGEGGKLGALDLCVAQRVEFDRAVIADGKGHLFDEQLVASGDHALGAEPAGVVCRQLGVPGVDRREGRQHVIAERHLLEQDVAGHRLLELHVQAVELVGLGRGIVGRVGLARQQIGGAVRARC